MTKKAKVTMRRLKFKWSQFKLPKFKWRLRKKTMAYPFLTTLPQLIIIAICLGLNYAMLNYYLFFDYGFYIYYLLKVIISFELLYSAWRSPVLVGCGLFIALSSLFTKCSYMNTLMNSDTAWELLVISLLGLFIYGLRKVRSTHSK